MDTCPPPRRRRPALPFAVATALVLAAATATATTTLGGAAPAAAADGAAGTGDPYYPDDGNGGYDVRHYDVRLAYDPATPDRLSGDTTVTARATERLDRFDLDLSGFTVRSVTVDGYPVASFARAGTHELVVTPARPVRRGATFAVRVRYDGEPGGGGWHTLDDGGANATGEPHGASSWYPADDHPSDKATFALAATVPDGWSAVGNGLPGPTTTTTGGDGRTLRTYRWHEDAPMATYLATVAIDAFTIHSTALADGTPVIQAYSPGLEPDPASEAQLPEILDFLASKFGPYPFSSAGAVVVPAGTGAGSAPMDLETQTRPTYTAPPFDASMVHENAHQWFGDNVSFRDWRDGCLAECFAQYAGQLWEEHQGADLDTGFYATELAANPPGAAVWSVPLYDPGKGRELDPALYEKGSMMLHALRRTVGDTAFFATLRRWQHDHAGSNAAWPQFERLAALVSGRDLKGFFDAWVRGTQRPADPYLRPGSLADPPR